MDANLAAPGPGPPAGTVPPPSRPRFPYAGWGPAWAVGGMLAALGAGIVFSAPAAVAGQGEGGELTTLGNVGVQIATALGFLLVPLAVASWSGSGSLRESLAQLGLRRFAPSALGWSALAAFSYLLFAALYSQLVVEPQQEDIAKGFGALPVQLALIVVAAPITEEICFRGMLFGGLRRRLPRLPAALLAGLLFGGLHVFTGPSAVPPLVAFGFVLCLLYERTGSIVPAIGLHMLNNTLALLALISL